MHRAPHGRQIPRRLQQKAGSCRGCMLQHQAVQRGLLGSVAIVVDWGSRPSLHEGIPRESPHSLKPCPALQSSQSVPTFEYPPSGDPPPGREWHADGQVRCSEAAIHQRQLMAALSLSRDSRHRRQSNAFRTFNGKCDMEVTTRRRHSDFPRVDGLLLYAFPSFFPMFTSPLQETT